MRSKPKLSDRVDGEESRQTILERLCPLVLLVILVFALWIRLTGIYGSLPFVYNPDEPAFLEPAVRMIKNGELNPHWFQHPGSTIIYLNALFICAVGIFTHWGWPGSHEVTRAFYADPTMVCLLARGADAVFGAAASILTYLVAARAFNSKLVGILSALTIAALPLHVRFSQITRTDVLATDFILATVYFALLICEKRETARYIIAGAFIGLGVATKFPAATSAFALVTAHVLSGPGWQRDWWKVVLAAGASILAAFLVSPYLFLDIQTVLHDLAIDARPTHYGNTGTGFVGNMVWYIMALYRNFGWIGAGLCLMGIAVAIIERRVVILVFPVVFLIFISSLSFRWERWLIPLLPFVGMFAAFGLVSAISWVGIRSKAPNLAGAVSVGLWIALVAPMALKSFGQAAPRTDTRTVARDWVLQNIPPQSTVMLERYTPQLPVTQFKVGTFGPDRFVEANPTRHQNFIARGFAGEFDPEKILARTRIDYVVLSSGSYNRFKAQGYEKEWAKYLYLFKKGELIYEAQPRKAAQTGPTIQIIRIMH